MKIFNRTEPWEEKVNFIDEYNVFLGYDLSEHCCETSGWFICDKVVEVIPEYSYEPHTLSIYDIYTDITEYRFDIKYVKYVHDNGNERYLVIFRIINGSDELYIHLYNCHNGYYHHGFDFKQGENIIVENSI